VIQKLNSFKVLFKNAKPEFMEFGPYIYQETDTLDDLVWTQLESQSNGKMSDVVLATYNQKTAFTSAGDDFLDTKMY
jgi:hypothetical protein